MEIIESFVQNPEQVTFAGLFIALFYWQIKTSREREMLMMKTNKEREDSMQVKNEEREARYQETIDRLTITLQDVESIKETVDKINDKLD